MFGRWFGKGISIFLCLALLVLVAPPVRAQSQEVKVYVNGKRVYYRGGLSAYEDWSAGGRVMVPVRQTAERIPCTRVSWDEELQRSRISMSLNCDWTMDVFLDLYPGTYTAQVYDGVSPWPLDANMTYRLDAKTVLIRDAVHASGRMLADAFKCLSWWDDADFAFHIDCRRPSQVHQDLEAVMNAYPPVMDSDGNFVVPTVDSAYPMYPRTVEAYSTYVTQTTTLARIIETDSTYMTARFERWNDRVRLESKTNSGTVFGYHYGDFMQLRLDAREQFEFKNRLKNAKARTVGAVAAGGIILGAVGANFVDHKVVKAALTIMAGLGGLYVSTVKDSDIEAYDTCVSVAKYDARNRNLKDDDAVVTVAIRWPTSIHCIPYDTGSRVLTWTQFGQLGY